MGTSANLAVTQIRRSHDGKRIETYRALLPVDGRIGGQSLDVSRANLIRDIQSGKRVVTAIREGGRWVEGAPVGVTKPGYLRTDANDTEEDNLGELPLIEGQLSNRC